MLDIKTIFIVILLIFPTRLFYAETFSFVGNICKVKSHNNDYFLQTIPFDNINESTLGKTIVFKSDSTKIYEIPRYFEISPNKNELFLSDDGQTVAYIINEEYYWNKVQYKSIELYKNGTKFKEFSLHELITCDDELEDCFLFYNDAIDTIIYKKGEKNVIYKSCAGNFEKDLTKRAVYLSNDTLVIFCKTGKVIKLNTSTGDISTNNISTFNKDKIKYLDTLNYESFKFDAPIFGIPYLSSGKSLECELADFLGMKAYPCDKLASHVYKRYTANIELIIDTSGNAIIDFIEAYNNLDVNKIKEFLSVSKFSTNLIPKGIEKWKFSDWITLMNKDEEEAKKEREQECIEENAAYESRKAADSINGYYIPRNIEECFIELNKLLKKKDINAIKNLKTRDDIYLYHMGLGTALRNSWGLWGGSRLQQYFIKKGINHPDAMSTYILKFYYDWLNDKNEGWKEFESK